MQLVRAGRMTWAKKAAFWRNVPFTATNPTPRQIAHRIAFGEAASRAKGQKGLRDGLPPAAAIIKEMKGKFPTAQYPPPEKAAVKRTYHTIEELKALAQRR
jgi:hypothetical protein